MADVKVSALTALTGADLANGDQFLVTDVGSPNVSKSITADELAQGSQFTSRYVAKADDDKLFVPVGSMEITSGSPSVTAVGAMWPGRAFDDSADERMGAVVAVPGHWTTCNISVCWTRTVAGSGDVVFYRSFERVTGSGSALGGGGIAANIAAVAVPTASQLAVTSLATGQNCADATNSVCAVVVGRKGAEAADTFTGDIIVFGVLLEKAS